MAGVIATMSMQIQVKSQQQLYAEKLTKNGLCLSVDLETQPLVSDSSFVTIKLFRCQKFCKLNGKTLKLQA